MSGFLDVLKTLAPTVASALVGPMGGIAVAALGNIMGIDAPTQEKIAKAVTSGQMTAEQVAELQRLELQYKDSEAERGFKYSELEFKDAEGARAMQVATGSWVPGILAIAVTIGFFGILSWMLVGEPPKSDALLVMLGSLGTAWTTITSFYFGSSHGSQIKSRLLAGK